MFFLVVYGDFYLFIGKLFSYLYKYCEYLNGMIRLESRVLCKLVRELRSKERLLKEF